MKYLNAADVLPKELLAELSKYVDGKLIYVPSSKKRGLWGENTGAKMYYQDRNATMRILYRQGASIEDLSSKFGLSYDTIRKIVK